MSLHREIDLTCARFSLPVRLPSRTAASRYACLVRCWCYIACLPVARLTRFLFLYKHWSPDCASILHPQRHRFRTPTPSFASHAHDPRQNSPAIVISTGLPVCFELDPLAGLAGFPSPLIACPYDADESSELKTRNSHRIGGFIRQLLDEDRKVVVLTQCSYRWSAAAQRFHIPITIISQRLDALPSENHGVE